MFVPIKNLGSIIAGNRWGFLAHSGLCGCLLVLGNRFVDLGCHFRLMSL